MHSRPAPLLSCARGPILDPADHLSGRQVRATGVNAQDRNTTTRPIKPVSTVFLSLEGPANGSAPQQVPKENLRFTERQYYLLPPFCLLSFFFPFFCPLLVNSFKSVPKSLSYFWPYVLVWLGMCGRKLFRQPRSTNSVTR